MIKKITFRILISATAIVIILLILLPGIIKRYSINHSKEYLGRQIELDKLKLNYFTGTIRVTDFVMYEADDKEEFVSFDTLIIDLEPYQFFIDELVMERFYMKGLKAKVIQHDSTFNFDDLLAFHSQEEDAEVQDSSELSDFRFQLSNIEFKDAEFHFDDQNIEKTTSLRDISFFVPFIGWNQSDKSKAGLRFAFKNEGYFESSVNVDPVGGEYEAEITVYHLYLDTFKEYLANEININSIEGLYNSTLSIKGNINEIEKSLVSGFAEVIDLKLTDQQDKKFLGAKKIECVLKEMDVNNMSFSIDSLLLSEPYVYFELDTTTNNLEGIFNITPESGINSDALEVTYDTSAVLSSVPLYYAINHISIGKGVVDYRDKLTGEPFDYYLSEISMESDSIESTSKWIDLYAEMLLNKRGKLKAEVGLNPANPLDISFQYVISDFMLSDLNIYSRFYMGFPIVYGDMYYKSETEILGGQLSSENKLVITHVELGDKSGGLYDLPIKFALFLLKDRNGVITLDVPVRGDLNDPTVKVGKIIWNTFKNLIIKIAASPFDALSRLLGVDPSDIKSIAYQYNDTTLTAERQKQLDLLLELEQKKEGLDIELVYFNDVKKEKEAIAMAQAGMLFNNETKKDYREEKEEFTNFVQSKMIVDTLDLSNACLQMVDPTVLDSLINMYAKIRKEQIHQHLFSVNDSTQIYTSISNPDSPKNLGSLPLFDVKYTMKDQHSEELEINKK